MILFPLLFSLTLIWQVSDLPNEKEAIFRALDKWTTWETEFPLIAAAKALRILRKRNQWMRVIQVWHCWFFKVFCTALLNMQHDFNTVWTNKWIFHHWNICMLSLHVLYKLACSVWNLMQMIPIAYGIQIILVHFETSIARHECSKPTWHEITEETWHIDIS